MNVNDTIKWKVGPHTHYGTVLTINPDGSMSVEYGHSVPAANIREGRVVTLTSKHKAQVVK